MHRLWCLPHLVRSEWQPKAEESVYRLHVEFAQRAATLQYRGMEKVLQPRPIVECAQRVVHELVALEPCSVRLPERWCSL